MSHGAAVEVSPGLRHPSQGLSGEGPASEITQVAVGRSRFLADCWQEAAPVPRQVGLSVKQLTVQQQSKQVSRRGREGGGRGTGDGDRAGKSPSLIA